MITTYLIENSYTKTVYGYYNTLGEAKGHLIRLSAERPIEDNAGVLRIVQLKGQYFGEGYHNYYCQYDSMKDKFIYDRRVYLG